MDGNSAAKSESLALTLTKQQPNNGLTGASKAACPNRPGLTMPRQAPVGDNMGEVFTQANGTNKMMPKSFS